jgi:hypothetical protein
VTTTLPINFSPVLLTPRINFRVFGYFWLVSTTPGKNVIASVNDTADKLFSGVNDTPDKLFTGVNDITDKFLLTRALLNLLRKGLGHSKPATLPWNKHRQHNMWRFYYIQAPWTAFYRIKRALQAGVR